MKLPLIVAASPKINETPSVSLSAGIWKLEDDCKNTQYFVKLSDGNQSIICGQGGTITISKQHVARVTIDKVGTEESISVFAHKLE